LATYLLPLLAAPDPDRGDLFGYAIYAIVIVIIALRSELAHINPTLYLFGFRTVTVQDANGTISRLICRQTPNPGEKVMVTRMYGVLHRVA
jgi:hypothetical protein